MTRIVLIAVLATAGVMAQANGAAQAQSRDERFAQPGSMPGFVTAIRASIHSWLGTKAANTPLPRPMAASAAASAATPVAARVPAPIATPRAKPKQEPEQKTEPTPAHMIAAAHAAAAETPAAAQDLLAEPVRVPLQVPLPLPAPRREPAPPFAARFAPAIEPPARTASRDTGCAGQRVTAAYYWQGTRTASGAPFDPHGMTAAHRTLPFGTRLTVTNPRTGQSVKVTINDRGPYTHGVSIDLSLGAAQAIGMKGTGAVCIL